MQFDIDMQSKFSEVFLKVREIILSFEGIREKLNAKQTSYYDKYSSVFFMRCSKERLTIALAKGSSLKAKYLFLEGNGKIVRHIYIKNLSELNENILRDIIQETMVLNLEAYELKLIQKSK